MSEENKVTPEQVADVIQNTAQGTVAETAPVETTPEVSEIEKRARSLGWVSKEEREAQGKDNAHYVEPEEYVRRQPLFERIEKQNSEIREMKQLQKQWNDHLALMRKESYERAIQELEFKRSKAVSEADSSTFNQADSQIRNMQQKMQTDPMITQAVPSSTTTAEDMFMQRNANWYNDNSLENKKMKAAAKAADAYFAQEAHLEGRSLNVEEHFKKIEEMVKNQFKHRFEEKKIRPQSVAVSTTQNVAGSASALVSQLSASQRQLAEHFVKTGAYKSIEDYAKDLKAISRLGETK